MPPINPDAFDLVSPFLGLGIVLLLGLWILFGDVQGAIDDWRAPMPADDYLTAVRKVRGETKLGTRLEGDPAREAALYQQIGSARVVGGMTSCELDTFTPCRFTTGRDPGDETR